ncbi:hypothetical protein [Paenibacillus qinlingensis]|uniref:hypothetical protein n=1 Tax=Paenibacillus qinlingensis TaxID=1837343 RepID=UPI001FECDC52|nr:hypothetical protein [Paenibacillus qinlingensis]
MIHSPRSLSSGIRGSAIAAALAWISPLPITIRPTRHILSLEVDLQWFGIQRISLTE